MREQPVLGGQVVEQARARRRRRCSRRAATRRAGRGSRRRRPTSTRATTIVLRWSRITLEQDAFSGPGCSVVGVTRWSAMGHHLTLPDGVPDTDPEAGCSGHDAQPDADEREDRLGAGRVVDEEPEHGADDDAPASSPPRPARSRPRTSGRVSIGHPLRSLPRAFVEVPRRRTLSGTGEANTNTARRASPGDGEAARSRHRRRPSWSGAESECRPEVLVKTSTKSRGLANGGGRTAPSAGQTSRAQATVDGAAGQQEGQDHRHQRHPADHRHHPRPAVEADQDGAERDQRRPHPHDEHGPALASARSRAAGGADAACRARTATGRPGSGVRRPAPGRRSARPGARSAAAAAAASGSRLAVRPAATLAELVGGELPGQRDRAGREHQPDQHRAAVAHEERGPGGSCAGRKPTQTPARVALSRAAVVDRASVVEAGQL